jgi:hypothetical protein
MVTAIVNNPGLVAGQVLDWRDCITYRGKKGSGVITRGNLLCPDTGTSPDSWKVTLGTAIPTYGPFAVCMATTTSAATEVSVAEGGVIALVADGTIEIGKPVMAATATAGQVITHTTTTVTAGTPTGAEVTSATFDNRAIVGVCLGFADNFWTTAPTAPVDGDLAAILMRKGL